MLGNYTHLSPMFMNIFRKSSYFTASSSETTADIHESFHFYKVLVNLSDSTLSMYKVAILLKQLNLFFIAVLYFFDFWLNHDFISMLCVLIFKILKVDLN